MQASWPSNERLTSSFWGKASAASDGTGRAFLPLTDHCLDVAAVFHALASLPVVRSRLQQAAGAALSDAQLARLSVFACLHDLGKCNLGFQKKIFDPHSPRIGHVREIGPLLEEYAGRTHDALRLDTLSKWVQSPPDLEGFLVAAWSHHGRPVRYDPADRAGAPQRWWGRDGTRDPFAALRGLLHAAHRAYPGAFLPDTPPLPASTRLQHRFCGLVMLADWLGSHESFFPIRRPPSFDARLAACQALQRIGMDVREQQAALRTAATSFFTRFGFTPRPMQAAVAALPAEGEGARLLITEAETGSGKTEAALSRFFTLFAAGAVDGLYFALPTRVAARELYERVRSYIERVFPNPGHRPGVVLAVPGYVCYDGIPLERLLPPGEVREHDEEDLRRRERLWAAERPKRFLASAVAVGTVDQALLSAVQVPHAHLRSVCLDRSLLVVDEVHASDPYMRALLLGLLHHHVSVGGHALLLSATLGARARAELTGHPLPSLEEACRAPYPALTDRSGVPKGLSATTGSPGSSKTVRVELVPALWNPALALQAVRQAVSAGGRVLVVQNTVARAVAFQRALEAAGTLPATAWFRCCGVICPHHGRYAPPDREVLDQAASSRLGSGSSAGPAVVVGTQTLEQSLDLDADLLVSDLAPMDVLLQRIGRLHRHRRKRPPGLQGARCLLLVPPDRDLENLLDERGEPSALARRAGIGSVYPDVRAMQRTRDLLAEWGTIEIPRDNRRLVEQATHPQALAVLAGERWARHAQAVDGTGLAQRVQAHFALLPPLYEQAFNGFSFHEASEAMRTRLGLDTLRVPLSRAVESPFGVPLPEMLIPAHLLGGAARADVAEVLSASAQEIGLAYGGTVYRYSRFGLERQDERAD